MIIYNQGDNIKLLLDYVDPNGEIVDVNRQNKYGYTVLLLASEYDNKNIVKLIFDYPYTNDIFIN